MRYYPQDQPTSIPEFVCATRLFPAERVGPWLSAILQSSMDGVIVMDASQRAVLVNAEAARLFGQSAADLLGQPVERLLPARLRAEHQAALGRLMVPRLAGRRLQIRFDSTGLRRHGDEFPFEASISRVTVRGEKFFAIILRELFLQPASHHKLHTAHSEFRRRAACSQRAHEVEKRRFARVLYDDLGQSLSVLKLDMDWLRNQLQPEHNTAMRCFGQMQDALDRIIARTRNIASTLRPPLLDDFGLVAAVQWVADEFQKNTGISCSFKNQTRGVNFGDLTESAIFRLVQESLFNVERHAGASCVRIFLWQHEKSLDVLIQDDGVGIAHGSISKPGCYGLIAMQERVYALGGSLGMTNVDARGMAIHASVPIDSP
jgi:PAS domain S-box-containing protein